MNVLIRVDYSPTIGMGHLMRCITLASILQEKSARIIFAVADLNGNGNQDVRSRGFECYNLSTNLHCDEISWETDADETIKIIKKLGVDIDWLIVDHYGIDAKWEKSLQSYSNKMMVIDDLANRPHDCDLLLDQNLYHDQQTRYSTLLHQRTKLLLGVEYALLRREFKLLRDALPKSYDKARRILISFGGGEVGNVTLKALHASLKIIDKSIAIDVVVGSTCSRISDIKAICKKSSLARFFHQIDNMAGLMMHADLAIGAGGTTSWERCCLGLPSIVMTIANNQVALARELSSLGVVRYLGAADQVEEEQLANELTSLLSNTQLLSEMSTKGRNLVDGMGSEKVANSLMEKSVYG